MEYIEPCKIVGIGKVKIKMFDGTIKAFGLVRHVLGLNKNIISSSTTDSKVTCRCGVLKVSKGARVLLKGRNESQFYGLDGSMVTVEVVVAYSLISGNSGKVECDGVTHGDLNNDTGKSSSSSGETSLV